MGANSAQFDIIINAVGHLDKAVKELRGLGTESDNVNKKTREGSKAQNELNYKLNQGAAASASAGRNMSKLAQTIGSGPNGLVGAYATLAANAFAVSAAFNALRSAEQAQMVLRGLEEQGARTGRTLTVAADSLREVVGFGISAQDSMKATAQFTSAGFSTDELQRLGKVAQESSLALGRNLPDSLDRLIKGTTKLEPELLDELGIMTKLGDATSLYALQTNKSASSLTQFEKRQAFLNAVLAEGELKFGGLSDAIDTNPYDKLAGKFDDLQVKALSFINDSGLLSFISYLASNIISLGGVVVLFASTLRQSLLGSLNDLSAKSVAAAVAAKNLAAETRKGTLAEIEAAKARNLASLQQARQLELHAKSTQFIKDRSQAIKDGTLTEEEFNSVLKSNERSIRSHTSLLEREKVAGKDTTARKALIQELEAQGSALEELKKKELDYKNNVTTVQGAALKSMRTEFVLISRARAQEAAASAIQAASNLNLTLTITSLERATRQYAIALAIESKEKIAAARASGVFGGMQASLIVGINATRVAVFGAITALKALAASFLRVIPYIGMLMLGLDALTSAYDYIYSKLWPNTAKAEKQLTAVSEEHSKVIENQYKALEYYNKISNSQASAHSRATAAILNEANSLIELADSYNKVIEAIKAKAKAEQLDSEANTSDNGINKQKSFQEQMILARAKSWNVDPQSAALDLGAKAIKYSTDRFFSAYRKNDAAAQDFVSGLDTLEKRLGKEGLTKALDEAAGGLGKFNKASYPDQQLILAKVLNTVADSQSKVKTATEELNDAFKKGETSANKFFTNAIGKTPFDDIVDSFESINKSLRGLQREGKSATEQLQLLSGIGPELQKFLDPKQSTMLDSLREADTVIQALKGRESELTGTEKSRYEAAKNTLKENEKNLPVLQAALEKIEEENKLRQAAAALAKAQASLIQAQTSKYSQFLNSGAAGMKAQIESQEKVNALNVAGLAAQKAVLQTMLTQQDLKLQAMKDELEGLKVKRDQLLLEQQHTLELAKQAQISSKLTGYGPLASGYVVNPSFNADEAVNKAQQLIDANKGIQDLNDRIKTFEDSLRSSRLQLQALSTEIAAATAGNLTNAQQKAKESVAAAEAALNTIQKDLATFDAATAANKTGEEYFATLSGQVDTLGYKLQQIDYERSRALERINLENKAQIDVVKTQIDFAKTMLATAPTSAIKQAVQETIKNLENTKVNLESQLTLNSARINKEAQINTLNAIGLETEEKRLQAAKSLLDIRQKESDALEELIAAQNQFDKTKSGIFAAATGTQIDTSVQDAREAYKVAKDTAALRINTINLEYALLEEQRRTEADKYAKAAEATKDIDPSRSKALSDLSNEATSAADRIASARANAISAVTQNVDQKALEASQAQVTKYTNILLDNFKKLGPGGEAAMAVFSGVTSITNTIGEAFKQIGEAGNDTTAKIGAIAGAAASALGAVISMVSAISNAKIASVDKEIAAEEKRDGKSAESVAKLDALEKKKDAINRRAFNTNKKLMMAQAVVSTASAVAQTLGKGGWWAIPLAIAVGAMGAAQLAIIAGTQYESSYTPKAIETPSTLTIGKRDASVDLAKGPNASAGGEVGYLRGSSGTGTNASNYRTVGSAYGGELMRGYGNRGFVVGEKGPEVITPETPITVTPANDTQGGQSINATINIQALDSDGVKDILVAQKGNLIKMLREAANASGKTFMEDVNVNVYTRPSVGKL